MLNVSGYCGVLQHATAEHVRLSYYRSERLNSEQVPAIGTKLSTARGTANDSLMPVSFSRFVMSFTNTQFWC